MAQQVVGKPGTCILYGAPRKVKVTEAHIANQRKLNAAQKRKALAKLNQK